MKKSDLPKPRVLMFTVLLALLTMPICVLLLLQSEYVEDDTVPAQTSVSTVQDSASLTSSAVFVGEVFWGRGIERASQLFEPVGYGFPFSGIPDELHNSYDNWIGDLECPVTTVNVPYQTQVDYLQLNCRPEFLPEAAKLFDVFTLANNHMYDSRGEVGQLETRQHLDEAHIQYFGDYIPSVTENICEVITFNAKSSTSTAAEPAYMPVAMCGYMYVVDTQPTSEELAVMRAYADVMPVIAMPHMGVEYRQIAEQEKVDAYHAMIDAGADVVLASHPHVIQNSESYKGKLIQYSPGNFIFDQQIIGRDNTLSLGVGLTLSIKDPTTVKTYNEIGQTCKNFKDDCLALLKQRIQKRPKIDITYIAECFYEPEYKAIPADEATCNEIKKQATWEHIVPTLSSTW